MPVVLAAARDPHSLRLVVVTDACACVNPATTADASTEAKVRAVMISSV